MGPSMRLQSHMRNRKLVWLSVLYKIRAHGLSKPIWGSVCCQICCMAVVPPCSGLRVYHSHSGVWLFAASLSANPDWGLPMGMTSLSTHALQLVISFWLDHLDIMLFTPKEISQRAFGEREHSIIWSLVEIKLSIVEKFIKVMQLKICAFHPVSNKLTC